MADIVKKAIVANDVEQGNAIVGVTAGGEYDQTTLAAPTVPLGYKLYRSADTPDNLTKLNNLYTDTNTALSDDRIAGFPEYYTA